ncbi:tetratricopeptide repeat protein [Dactylosporangium sp. NPDC051484]|uniref:tetratricopeptide repeat protein n=1 Tax=Dactylosporangium sp. NPDC051484 TaxID=3154942 RepID=UPI00344C0F76
MQIIEHSVIGTRSAVLRLRRPGAELQFVVFPMLHVSSPRFYADVTERLRRCDLLVVEGVGGRSTLGRAITLTYRLMPANKRSHLVVDNIAYGSLGVPLINPDVTVDEFTQSWRTLPWRARIVLWCVMPFVAVMQFFGGRRHLLGPEVELSDLPDTQQETFDDHELAQQLDDVFSGTRDERLLAALSAIDRERSAERIDVAVVYGAGHTTAIVHGLLKRHGYRPRTAEWLTVVEPEEHPVATARRRADRRREKAAARSATAGTGPASASSPHARSGGPDGAGGAESAAPRPARAVPASAVPAPDEPADARAEAIRVALTRRMASADPDAYQPKLAETLDALARRLSQLGRHEEALRAADEAVDVYDELEDRHPGMYRSALGAATSDFALQLDRLGRYADALAVDQQAVEILRGLDRNNPGGRADGLGHALTNLSVSLAQADRDDEALQAAQEAVELYQAARKQAAGSRTTAYSRALVILAASLETLGRHGEALDVAKRAANVCHESGSTGSAERAQQLAAALRSVSEICGRLGQHDEAAAATAEAEAARVEADSLTGRPGGPAGTSGLT